jgi:hypothetical protein
MEGNPDIRRAGALVGISDSTQPAFFDVDAQTSARFGDAIDVDIETLPDGWFRGTSMTMTGARLSADKH